ncbi:dihydrodipicolinate synthase family protein [Leeia sp. TBRC 13508]|uniref:Dihydrodipicolinate synthase family protein n=1 Tax=Leeia speluncae TaxID=2884804 RepID=A0ABS8DB34_9NEIS|nr:dihydrodipicolinate synthase family protein [Leeia speluncae]MCB6185126.1 dihydrodipicolinate synthase family protein [Leeia speluncae]
MADLSGINLAMQTTFNADGSINFSAYEELIEQYLADGVHGLVLGAGTGQHPYLTEQECNKLYEIGIKRINGRCNVICQTSALNVDEVIRRSKHAEANGADALMVLPPYFEGPTDDDGLFSFYEELDSAIKVDVVGYNIPQSTGIAVSVPLLLRLAELPSFNYIKDSGGDMTTHQQYLQTSVKVLNGADTIAPFAFMGGAVGAIQGTANYMPKEAVKLYNLIKEKKLEEALELWKLMLPSVLLLWTGNYLPMVLKAAHLRGYGTGNLRKPLRAISAQEELALKEAIAPLLK